MGVLLSLKEKNNEQEAIRKIIVQVTKEKAGVGCKGKIQSEKDRREDNFKKDRESIVSFTENNLLGIIQLDLW